MEDPTVVKFPETFDGRFFFTNFSDEDFVAKWNNVEYVFPASKTSPILIPEESLQNIQNIRKKFARELAEREFYKSEKLKKMEAQTPVGQGEHLQTALTYTPKDLQPYIDKCLAPLPVGQSEARKTPRKEVQVSPHTRLVKASVTEEGSLTGADSLVGNGTVIA